MNLEQSLNKLYSLHQFGIKLGLDNISKFLDRLDNPQTKFKSFHVAGTNGKGSTVSFICSLLMEKGCKTGLYTSPHFVKFNERIRIGPETIPDDYVSDFIVANDKYIDDNQLTFFEVTTALAFKYFQESKVDFAAIETGLGGRLDATNTIHPLASAITSISMEHTDILGDSIAKIAYEKAGIIKNNSKVFIGIMPKEAEEIMIKTADERNCEKYLLNDFIKFDNDYLTLKLKDKNYKIYSTPLKGNHQLLNAALAVKTFATVQNEVNQDVINRGIAKVVQNTGIQGRYEIYKEIPQIILDSAHNPEGVRIFVNEFNKVYKKYSKRIIIFTALRDKAVIEMISILAPYFNQFYVTSVKNDRTLSIAELTKLCKELGVRAKAIEDPWDILSQVEKMGEKTCIAVLGSMYLIGELKEKILKNT